jgi:hypothetical protein
MINIKNVYTPYLKVTLGDNDFTSNYNLLGSTILQSFRAEYKYPTKDDFDNIKEYIARLWWSLNNLTCYMRWKDTTVKFSENDYEYFINHIKLDIVDYTEIPEQIEDFSDIYIPLFDSSNDIFIK